MSNAAPTGLRARFSAIAAPFSAAPSPAGARCRASACCSLALSGLLLGLSVSHPALANSPAKAMASAPKQVELQVDALHDLIDTIAAQEGVEPELMRAVVATESQFNPRSVSSRGAVGLMQLMPAAALEVGINDRFNPEENLRGGARYLRRMLERFSGDIRLALAAYNAGPGSVERFQGVPPYPETRRYIGKVMANYSRTVPGLNQPPKRNNGNRRPDGIVTRTDGSRLQALLQKQRPHREVNSAPSSPYIRIRRTTYQTRVPPPDAAARKDIYEDIPVIRLSRR